ncbi:Protein YIPF1 [Symbiodinium microadriaticum]|uniref:Protein YIPF1 n=1 Tax=Symbiodinium microadriaticum TaxID=2951 RepID=A0A1Q9C8U1_SYMMI|nr:Protein YIPF1 [Symbiodinium microadriaticum]CAE7940454.1 YIPF1 [Symbiodinium sp. KB8]
MFAGTQPKMAKNTFTMRGSQHAVMNKTQWDRPSWDEASGTSDVFQYKPTAADLEVRPQTTPVSTGRQELDDIFMGAAPQASELVSLKDEPTGTMGSSSQSATQGSHIPPQASAGLPCTGLSRNKQRLTRQGEDEKKGEDIYADLEPELKVHAAACNNDVKMLEKLGEESLLQQEGVDFNQPRPQAIVGAASWGDPDLLKVLLDAGGPVDQELSNETALRWAVQYGHEELVLRRAKGTLAREKENAEASGDHRPDSAGGLGGYAAGFAAGAAAAAGGGAAPAEQGGITGFSAWVLALAQSLFDVSTDDVVRRLKLLSPYPAPDRSTAEEMRARPDFYGPFWIATTAVLFLAATGNFARLVESEHPSLFKADYSLVPLAASIIYGGLIAVPLLARVSVFFTDEEVGNIDFKQIICVCGYGLAPSIPVSILCIIPVSFLRWVFVLGGLALSVYFLRANLLMDFSVKVRWLQLTLIVSPVLLQVLVFLIYRVRFFAGDRQ